LVKLYALLAGLKWYFAFTAVVGLAVFSYHGFLPSSSYDLKVLMPGADGLYPGSDVLIAGSRAGIVTGITLHGDQVLVGMSLDPAHSPVHSDATITLRPKSLLGEKYLDLYPGSGGASALDDGATLPPTKVKVSTDLQDVINTFDQPTRAKLQVVIDNLGGGIAGQGPETNQTIAYGTKDLTDLAEIATTLQQRDKDLQTVIQALDAVTAELAASDKRQALGELIANSDRLIKNLAQQDAQLKAALASTNAALSKTNSALDGAQGNLASIFQQTPALVHNTDRLFGDLNTGAGSVVGALPYQAAAIRETAIVFGGKDAAGYATRISVLVGTSSPGAGPSQPGGPNGVPLPIQVPPTGGTSDGDLYNFLLGGPQ
jgi:phospholipid/cholesterol/gamma-HCH transport system substrate-binding protein